MPGVLTASLANVKHFLATAEPDRVTTEQAVHILEAFTELERVAAAGKTLFADRAVQSAVWVDEGHASPSSWLAERTKGSLGDAVATLETSRRLQGLEDTTGALRSGRLSSAQVREVARAADKDPAAEGELLRLAADATLTRLKDRARQVMAQASSREEEAARYRAIRDSRYVRHCTDHLGAFRLEARLTPDAGARVLSSLDAEADALFDEARQAGEQDRPDAYRADALVALLAGDARTRPAPEDAGGTSNGGRTRRGDTVVVRIDAAALRRGYVEGGETCEIAGVGPVPVSTAHELLPSSFVKLLVTDSVDVLNVCHVGRSISAHLETALEERDRTCVVPGCDVARGLEKHHFREDFAASGRTSLSELARVCHRHHDMITYDGYVLGGGPGAWTFHRPPGQHAYADTG